MLKQEISDIKRKIDVLESKSVKTLHVRVSCTTVHVGFRIFSLCILILLQDLTGVLLKVLWQN